MFERFTEKAIKVVMLSQEESRRLGHNFVGTEQILLGLVGETGELRIKFFALLALPFEKRAQKLNVLSAVGLDLLLLKFLLLLEQNEF